LSFEFSVGAERIIVNCGASASDRAEWREAQSATAAHSTVTVDDTNSIEVMPDGFVGRRPKRVGCARDDGADGTLIDASHDGYRKRFGIVHRRRLRLTSDGSALHGEDVLTGSGGNAFAARFHLHPTVTAVLIGDGRGALLRTPSGIGWRMRAVGGEVNLVESIYMGRYGETKRCEQLVVSGPLEGARATIDWTLTRVKSRN